MNRLGDKMNSSTIEEKMNSSNLATIPIGSTGLTDVTRVTGVIPVEKFQRAQ